MVSPGPVRRRSNKEIWPTKVGYVDLFDTEVTLSFFLSFWLGCGLPCVGGLRPSFVCVGFSFVRFSFFFLFLLFVSFFLVYVSFLLFSLVSAFCASLALSLLLVYVSFLFASLSLVFFRPTSCGVSVLLFPLVCAISFLLLLIVSRSFFLWRWFAAVVRGRCVEGLWLLWLVAFLLTA